MITGEGVEVDGQVATPPVLNDWMTANNGYFDGDRFNFPALDPLGFEFGGLLETMDQTLEAYQDGYFVILNVLNETHWVLVTGTDGNGFYVLDPYYNTTYYAVDLIDQSIYYGLEGAN